MSSSLTFSMLTLSYIDPSIEEIISLNTVYNIWSLPLSVVIVFGYSMEYCPEFNIEWEYSARFHSNLAFIREIISGRTMLEFLNPTLVLMMSIRWISTWKPNRTKPCFQCISMTMTFYGEHGHRDTLKTIRPGSIWLEYDLNRGFVVLYLGKNRAKISSIWSKGYSNIYSQEYLKITALYMMELMLPLFLQFLIVNHQNNQIN